MTPSPDTLWRQCWDLVARGSRDKKHAFNTPCTATVTPEGWPRQRTLVLRDYDREAFTLSCWTDRRSLKVRDLDHHNVFHWCFWDPRSRIQFTTSGPTEWLSDDRAHHLFDSLPKHSRKSYATVQAPSSALAEARDGLPGDWEARELAETRYAREHFGVLVTRLERAEVLRLDRQGHLRMAGTRGQGKWDLAWVVP